MMSSTLPEPNSKPTSNSWDTSYNSRPKLCGAVQTRYCSGIGKLLYLVRWLQLEIMNSIWELTQFMTEAYLNCVKGMEHNATHPLHVIEGIGHAAR